MWRWLPLCLALTGCGQPAGPLGDYPKRVAKVLEVDFEPQGQQPLAAGGGRAWATELESITIGLTELYALRKCHLGALIGERNSALGKVAPPSQRFLYEVELLHGLRHCDRAPADTRALARELAEQKAQLLPRQAWQLLATDHAFRQNWRHGISPLSADEFPGLYDAITAISDIQALLTAWDPAKAARLESELAALAHGRILARLNVSLHLASHQLDQAAALIEHHQQQVPCPGGRPGPQARLITQFFMGYYGNGLQPYLGQLQQANRALTTPLWALIQTLPVPAQAQSQVHLLTALDEGSLSHRFDQALGRHTRAWQQFLGRCGLRPGQG